ncbi:hypothetical protein INR49_001382, partial [Caranx melampygus]
HLLKLHDVSNLVADEVTSPGRQSCFSIGRAQVSAVRADENVAQPEGNSQAAVVATMCSNTMVKKMAVKVWLNVF